MRLHPTLAQLYFLFCLSNSGLLETIPAFTVKKKQNKNKITDQNPLQVCCMVCLTLIWTVTTTLPNGQMIIYKKNSHPVSPTSLLKRHIRGGAFYIQNIFTQRHFKTLVLKKKWTQWICSSNMKFDAYSAKEYWVTPHLTHKPGWNMLLIWDFYLSQFSGISIPCPSPPVLFWLQTQAVSLTHIHLELTATCRLSVKTKGTAWAVYPSVSKM